MPLTFTPPVSTHGRYLVEPGRDANAPLLLGFHGYAEDAETQMARLMTVPGIDAWLVVSVQGLHRFYRGRGEHRTPVASWMTRQDRDLLIADNLRYVAQVVASVTREFEPVGPTVFAGFSQGVSMAFRAACHAASPAAAVVALGGDVPPELTGANLRRIPRAIIGRGTADHWYLQEPWQADVARVRGAGVDVDEVAFDGGHDWAPAFSEAVGGFLSRVRAARR